MFYSLFLSHSKTRVSASEESPTKKHTQHRTAITEQMEGASPVSPCTVPQPVGSPIYLRYPNLHERGPRDDLVYNAITAQPDVCIAFAAALKAATGVCIACNSKEETEWRLAETAGVHDYRQLFPLEDYKGVPAVLATAARTVADFIIMARTTADKVMIGSLAISTGFAMGGDPTSSANSPAPYVESRIGISCKIYIRDDPSAFNLQRYICWRVYEASHGSPPRWRYFITHGRYTAVVTWNVHIAVRREYDTDEARVQLAGNLDAFLAMAEAKEIASGRWSQLLEAQSTDMEQRRRKIIARLSDGKKLRW